MFISPSVFSPSCAVWALSPKSLVAAAGHRLFLLQLLRPLRLHRLLGCSGCSVAQLLWLLWLPARLLRLSACPLWLLAFIPYAKVKKLILTHYILFIWKDRSMFFPMRLFPLACCFSLFPMDLPGISSASASRPAAPPQRPSQQLCHGAASLQSRCHGAPASNKPHPAEKSTPVWLAIWRTWAGFANSQHRDAALAIPNNICAHSSFVISKFESPNFRKVNSPF